jgi:hypothetical protein
MYRNVHQALPRGDVQRRIHTLIRVPEHLPVVAHDATDEKEVVLVDGAAEADGGIDPFAF